MAFIFTANSPAQITQHKESNLGILTRFLRLYDEQKVDEVNYKLFSVPNYLAM
jgi:hypothetical protein